MGACGHAVGSPAPTRPDRPARGRASIDPPRWLAARTALHRARLAALRGEAEPPFPEALAALRETEEPSWIATALLEQAEWLSSHGRADGLAPLVDEAREIFKRLGAAPSLARAERLRADTR